MEEYKAYPDHYYFNDRDDTNIKQGDRVTFTGQFRLISDSPQRTDFNMTGVVWRLPDDGFTASGRRIYASEGTVVVVEMSEWRRQEPHTRPCFPLEWEEDTTTHMRVPLAWLYPADKEET